MSALEDAIGRTRREIAEAETPVRRELVMRYREAYDRIESDMMALTRRIEAARQAGEEINPDWLRRQGRYRSLLDSIDQEMATFADDGTRIVANGQHEARTIGTNGATAQARVAGYTVDVGSARVTPPAQDRLFAALRTGSPVADTLNRYPAVVRELIDRELFSGLAEGRNPREVARRIRRAAQDGVRWRLEALTRTEMMRSLRGGLVDQYGGLGVSQVVWRAAKSPRTCMACLALDGTTYPITNPPDTFHPNCRCVISPVPRSLSREAQAAPQTGEQWFAQQPADVQRRMLGSEDAYAAYRRGDLSLADFVAYRFDGRFGQTVYAKTPRQALRGQRRAA